MERVPPLKSSNFSNPVVSDTRTLENRSLENKSILWYSLLSYGFRNNLENIPPLATPWFFILSGGLPNLSCKHGCPPLCSRSANLFCVGRILPDCPLPEPPFNLLVQGIKTRVRE
ncbi:hypothetical protein TNCV_2003091 [Trichonephila clavipes]|nr:hypothetical protein TNCV_2003091 [Trichonephila clavipes]